MAQSPNPPQRQLELHPAAIEQQPVLAYLLSLYARDFRAFHPVPVDEAGQFHYSDLALYWQDPSRHPFLIHVDQELAGFLLIRKTSAACADLQVWDIAEFFVLHAFRRQSIGTLIAHQVWTKFPGPWQVRVMLSNVLAYHFWQNAIASYAGENFSLDRIEKDAKQWAVFRFNSRPNPALKINPAEID